jgi:hypothetical protein
MIAGAGNFPSGSSRCESFLFNPTIADEKGENNGKRVKNARMACKQGSNNISSGCDRSEFSAESLASKPASPFELFRRNYQQRARQEFFG